MDREYMQSVIDKLEEAGIESLFTGQTEQNVWKRMIHFMEAAVDLQEELNLDLDKQMWGYSLLSVLQTANKRSQWRYITRQATISMINELLQDDPDGLAGLQEVVLDQISELESNLNLNRMLELLADFEMIGVKKHPARLEVLRQMKEFVEQASDYSDVW